MARRRNTGKRIPVLSEHLKSGLLRILALLSGLALTCGAILLFVALYSHDPADPSLNVATSATGIHNRLGQAGAIAADLVRQTVGSGGYVMAVLAACWGLCLMRGRPPGKMRLLGGVVCVLLSSLFLHGISGAPDTGQFPLPPGGFSGVLLARQLDSAIAATGFPAGHFLVLAATAVILFPLTVMSAGIFPRGFPWRTGLLALRIAGNATGRLPDGSRLSGRLRSLFRRPPAAGDTARRPAAGNTRRQARDGEKPAPGTGKQGTGKPRTGTDNAFALPSLELLRPPPPAGTAGLSARALGDNAARLQATLAEFSVAGEIVHVRPGPVVTLYEFEPAPGIKSSRIISLADDLARSMSAVSARVAVIPGKSTIGIELPNPRRETVYLRELLESRDFLDSNGTLAIALGKNIGGDPVIADLARMPHLLIAGTTGSGKSVAINTMLLSLLYRLSPGQCRFIMIDPKMLELSVYDGIPHLLAPVVTEPARAVVALNWAVREMESRYRKLTEMGVRNILGYNDRILREGGRRLRQVGFDEKTGEPVLEKQEQPPEPLPLIVIIVDEMADLMLVAGKEIESSVQRLAQMARAAGIHLVMATQRPSVDVVTGTIKANFPTRISFQVSSRIDSRTILGEMGAEHLLGSGDMLYMQNGGKISRVHGPFVTDAEVEQIVAMLRQQGAPDYDETVTSGADTDGDPATARGDNNDSADNLLYDRAVDFVRQNGRVSTSLVQRHLRIGYNRAAILTERMERDGIISRPGHNGRREVL